MFCKNCGKEIDSNAVVCPNCGAATDNFKSETAKAETSQPFKSTNIFAIIGFALSVLSFIFAFVNDIIFWITFVGGLTLSILGVIWSVKKGANLKGLGIAGIAVCGATLLLWIILLIYALVIIGALAGTVSLL